MNCPLGPKIVTTVQRTSFKKRWQLVEVQLHLAFPPRMSLNLHSYQKSPHYFLTHLIQQVHTPLM